MNLRHNLVTWIPSLHLFENFKKEDKIIELKIKEINNELVIINEGLTDRELTSGYYINQYFGLREKQIVLCLNIIDEVVQIETNDFVYVIKEDFNGNKKLTDIVENLILKDSKNTTKL